MKAQVDLTCARGYETRTGEVLGPFAVVFYPDIEDGGRPYSVTHIPSGRSAARTRTKKHALHIARRFRDLPIDWSGTSGKFDFSKVSKRTVAAIKRIRAEALQA